MAAVVAEGRDAGAVDLGDALWVRILTARIETGRAVSDLLRPCEPRAARASQAGRA